MRSGTYADASGTCLVGYLPEHLTIEDIEKALPGVKNHGPCDGKVENEWIVKHYSRVFTVYDWKGHRWHVGGDIELARKLLPWWVERA